MRDDLFTMTLWPAQHFVPSPWPVRQPLGIGLESRRWNGPVAMANAAVVS